MSAEQAGRTPSPASNAALLRSDDERKRMITSGVAVAAMLAVITLVHFLLPPSSGKLPLHVLFARLYFVPVIYAAWVFGRRGGLGVGLLAAVLFGIHAEMQLNAPLDGAFNNWLEVFSFVIMGTLFGALRDVEERRTDDLREVSSQLEEAYRKLEERAIQLINVQDYTSSILRSITSGVLTVGPDGSVATANPAAERMLAMSEFEMVPKPIRALFRDDAGLALDVAKVLEGRIPLALREASVVTASGRELHVQMSTSRMRAVGGAVLGAVVTLEDVSDVRALTDQLIRADRLAAMGELTAGVAHEVRNPLGVIRASVQLVEDANCDQKRISDASDVIKQEIDRLDRVVKALLDFGRPSRPTMVSTDLGQVLEDVVLFTTRFAKQANVRIELAPVPELRPVRGDADQLKQVFLNLVTNAVQAMSERGGEIRVEARPMGDYVTVTVSDTGPGISSEDLTKIYDPFFTKRAEGTGLGLTIVHRIIDEHSGHIEVESSQNGTTFTVTLPVEYEE